MADKMPEREDSYISAAFQSLLIIITCIGLVAILYVPLTQFTSRDTVPDTKTFTPRRLVDFGLPQEVLVGLYIKDFPDSDFLKGTLTVDGIVWFIFDVHAVSLDAIGKFSFENGEIKYKSEPYSSLLSDNKVFVRYNIRADFVMQFQYSLFPVDDHRLYFTLVNNFLSPGQVVFNSLRQDFVINTDLAEAGWMQVNKHVRTGYSKSQLDVMDKRKNVYNPRAVFSADYERIGIRHVISILLPLLLIFFVSLFAFSFDISGPQAGEAFSLAVGGITAMVAYYFVIQNMSPPVGYFMISDYLYFLFLSLNFFVFLVTIFKAEVSLWYKRIILILIHLIILSVSFYLFIF